MATVGRTCCHFAKRLQLNSTSPQSIIKRWSNTVPQRLVERQRESSLSSAHIKKEDVDKSVKVPKDFTAMYPEFLPNRFEGWITDNLRDALERKDMLNRRRQIHLPEFYVGSLIAVSAADHFAPNKTNRFVGICIDRFGQGLNHCFILRNVIDGQGVEIKYFLYNPTIQKIEVLKLEKRADEHLRYLRDAPQEYSTVSFDLKATLLPRGQPVPVNNIKITLNPKPWLEKWERQELNGAEFTVNLSAKQQKKFDVSQIQPRIDKFDLMKKHRTSVSKRERESISREMYKSNTMED
ncbi:39S ribosomal protein L19, mitochondrial-like [Mizuhopecten yessoensis]|uniref:Large ribosomal subunit protein bL19m n=1 Tax=Mizuhopecten yessoensis TaxID=6573 RepID=A0A210PMD9_MIZYE|nr:39S ribosomal protein L19, mitochondrial-like [Mizuhopecten yessoensis]OWF37658.1 39S ribosomal protein L19, mitochondrial [Mizuhopecten yessoensis]